MGFERGQPAFEATISGVQPLVGTEKPAGTKVHGGLFDVVGHTERFSNRLAGTAPDELASTLARQAARPHMARADVTSTVSGHAAVPYPRGEVYDGDSRAVRQREACPPRIEGERLRCGQVVLDAARDPADGEL
jgi:hypothetical protein